MESNFERAFSRALRQTEHAEVPGVGITDGWDVTQPSRGLGDPVAKIIHATGIDRLVKAATKAVGIKDCGCAGRQKLLNQRFPYKRNDGGTMRNILPPIPARTWISAARLAQDGEASGSASPFAHFPPRIRPESRGSAARAVAASAPRTIPEPQPVRLPRPPIEIRNLLPDE